jgi:nicotinamidase-related amidase
MSKDTALIVIDAQMGVVGEAYHHDEILENIQQLLARARHHDIPVLYVQHNDRWMRAGEPSWQIHPTVAPLVGEPIIQKESPDAFHATSLQAELDALGVKKLVITGGQTQYCIDTSVRRAVALGYDVLLVSNAHTTEDSETLPADKIIAFSNETLQGFWADEHRVNVLPAHEISF